MEKAKILIIDPSSGFCAFIAEMLASAGYNAFTATSYKQGIKLLARNRPALILADKNLPGAGDPLIWVSEINRQSLPTQVLALTSEPDFNQAIHWISQGVFSVLLKPMDQALLMNSISAALDYAGRLRLLFAYQAKEPDPTDDPCAKGLNPEYLKIYESLDLVPLASNISNLIKTVTNADRINIKLSYLFKGYHFFCDGLTVDETQWREKINQPGTDDFLLPGTFCLNIFEQKRPLAEIFLYFADENKVKALSQPLMDEIAEITGKSLANALKYQKAMTLASRDGLTGLYNRRVFSETLKREFACAKRHNTPLSLLIFDIDHFKKINDEFGHPVGDQVLKWLAGTLSRLVREVDVAARIGGEEFAVILPKTTAKETVYLAKRLQDELRSTNFCSKLNTIKPTVSQGIVDLEHFMVKIPEDLVYWADQAMYRAKYEGRDTICLADDLTPNINPTAGFSQSAP